MFLPSNITLKFGDSGDFVAELQRRLSKVRCFSEDQVNGFYDGNTVNGVTSFQAREGLSADGVAGPETLRRLNGVIAGDTSSNTDDKKEDEVATAAIQQSLTNDMMAMALSPAIEPFAYAPPTHSPYGEEAYAQPATAPITIDQVVQQPTALALEQQRQSDQLQHDIVAQQHVPSPEEMLARMQQQVAALAPTPTADNAPKPHHPPQQLEHPQPNVLKAEPSKAELPKEAAPEAAAKDPEKSTEPKTIGGRIRHFANAVIQKLADHFESKLRPDILAEVQSIGMTMAKSGMKEAPIPAGPELAGRGPELPSRGPEQGAPQRG